MTHQERRSIGELYAPSTSLQERLTYLFLKLRDLL
jgi:hypothetical protein